MQPGPAPTVKRGGAPSAASAFQPALMVTRSLWLALTTVAWTKSETARGCGSVSVNSTVSYWASMKM